MQEPTVTIVVPAYQRLNYLQEAVASGLRQTYRDFELIVSDDGAADEIAEYVASIGDARLRYRRNSKNLGIAMNNFVAFSEARGKYIASLHDDDVWEPEFLATLIPPLEADDEISVSFCDHHLMDERGRLLPDRTERNTRFFGRHHLNPGRHQPFIKPAVIDQAIPMVMAAVFRKSILDGAEYPRRLGGSYDQWLAYLAVRNGQACFYFPQRLTRYRVHESSGSKTRGVRNLRDTIYVRRKFLADANLAPYRRTIRNGLGVYYGKMALSFLEIRSFWRGKAYLIEAFRLLHRPKNIAALAVNAILVISKKRKIS
jgi:glycosyltransferase involved in cell wall biosynthesis